MMKKHTLPLCATVLATILCGCHKNEGTEPPASHTLTVRIGVVTDMATRTAATEEENRVNAFDAFLFDAETGLLEAVQRDVTAVPSTGQNPLGQLPIGSVTFNPENDRTKHILIAANTGDGRAVYPDLEPGTTTYSEMLQTVAFLEADRLPALPLVMSGYLNDVRPGDETPANVSLLRRTAKITVANLAPERLAITSLQLTQAADRALLFTDCLPDTETAWIDCPATDDPAAPFYVFPLTADENRMTLRIAGTLDDVPFTQETAVRPCDGQGTPIDMRPNTCYVVKLSAETETVAMQVTVRNGSDWQEGPDIHTTVSANDNSGDLVAFNGLQWMDRNLGATSSDLENAWDEAIGDFYQWGRNVAFGTEVPGTVSGPLTAEEAASETNNSLFITKMNGDWLSPSDDTLWASADRQPCPEGYRLPTVGELMDIFTPAGVLMNMYNGPRIIIDEPLSTGNATGHYFGDNTAKVIYGIKRQGTEHAYLLRWEYLKTAQGNAYARISRWPADASSSFADKSLTDVRDEFDALGAAPETIVFPAAGCLTGSSGSYSSGGKNGYYWCASPNGKGAHRAEITDGKMIAGDTYNSRISGQSLRCVKE